MPESCTCGAVLVENARFCHRCSRPVDGTEFVPEPTPAAETAAAAPASQAAPARALPPVSFANPIALRVAFLMSLGLMVVQMIPGVNLLFVLWWLGAGFGAVIMYR